jgi:hypothetical protein
MVHKVFKVGDTIECADGEQMKVTEVFRRQLFARGDNGQEYVFATDDVRRIYDYSDMFGTPDAGSLPVVYEGGVDDDLPAWAGFDVQQEFVPQCSHSMVPVKLTNQVTVYASSSRLDNNGDGTKGATAMLYLDRSWLFNGQLLVNTKPMGIDTRPMAYCLWPDAQAIPIPEFKELLDWAGVQVASGQKLMVGCVGGHGRTGTVLAGLAIRLGMPAKKAIEFIRKEYCNRAIETKEQEKLLHTLADNI